VHCRDHAVQLHRAREQFEAAGAEVVLIGMGSSRQAAWFAGKYAPDLRILADEDRASYKALGLKVGSPLDLVGPKAVSSGLEHARRSGVVQGRPVGNIRQLGGALVVAPGGEVLLEQRSSHSGDSVEVEDLLAALRGARRG
jgi:hypothetical protein